MAHTRMARLPWMFRALFFSPYGVLLMAQRNGCLGIFACFVMELCVVCAHWGRLIEAILVSTLNIQSLCGKSKGFPQVVAICFLGWCRWPSVA